MGPVQLPSSIVGCCVVIDGVLSASEAASVIESLERGGGRWVAGGEGEGEGEGKGEGEIDGGGITSCVLEDAPLTAKILLQVAAALPRTYEGCVFHSLSPEVFARIGSGLSVWSFPPFFGNGGPQ